MTTLDGVTSKKPAEQSAEQQAAAELVRLAQEGLSLTGPDGLLKQLTKTVLEIALNEEMTEHMDYEKNDPAGVGTGNIRNGTRAKTVLTDTTGPVELDVPRDRAGSFEPQIVKERQRPTCTNHRSWRTRWASNCPHCCVSSTPRPLLPRTG
jgi:transposase-like protein